MEIKSERLKIRPLILGDVYNMRSWGYHETPLLGDYNFPNMSDKEIEKWFRYKTFRWGNKYYGVINEENKLIGYMGIKSIKRIKRESTLGIVFDPNYINRGYGTEALVLFLKYYFEDMKMRRMYLEVAEFNKRAYRVYEKLGFKNVGYYLDVFYDSSLDFDNPYFIQEKSSFVITDKKIYNYIYKMRINKKDFIEKWL